MISITRIWVGPWAYFNTTKNNRIIQLLPDQNCSITKIAWLLARQKENKII